MPSNEDIEAPLIPAGRLLPFLVVTVLFFLWAIPNNLNDILIRQFMKSFNIDRSSAAGIQIWFYLGYFLLAIPAGQLMRRFGYKAGIVTGLCLLGSGCLLFYPAAQAGIYAFFLVAQFVIASGLSFLETGSNSFIAQLGPAGSSERRLNLSQAFNPLGSISAGLIGTVFIFSGVKLSDAQVAAMQAAGTYQAYLHSETLRVVTPYIVLGCIAFCWALLVLMTKFPDLGAEDVSESSPTGMRMSLWQRHFVFAVLAQFLYVGAQVGTVEILHQLCGVCDWGGRQGRGIYVDRHAGGVCRGKIQLGMVDEAFPCATDADDLCGDQRCAVPSGGFASELVRRGMPFADQSVHVDHVPDDFRSGTVGHGREDQDCWIVAGDGNPGRGGANKADGNAAAAIRLYGAGGVLRRCGALWVVVRGTTTNNH